MEKFLGVDVKLPAPVETGALISAIQFFRSPPSPPCISYALVQATVGVGTVLNWDLILIRYQT